MWELDHKEGWTPKNLMPLNQLKCWRRLLRVSWTARRPKKSILKEINPECSQEGLMLKLKLQYFDHLMQRAAHWKRLWCWERLKAGGEGGKRGWDGWMASLTLWAWVWASSGRQWRSGKPGVLQSMVPQRVRHDWVTEQQQSHKHPKLRMVQIDSNHPSLSMHNTIYLWVLLIINLNVSQTVDFYFHCHHSATNDYYFC